MIEKIIHSRISLFFIASIIPMLAISILIADLIFSFYALIFLIYVIQNKLYTVFNNKFFILFFTFYLFSVVSSLISENILFSLKSSFFYLRAIIFIGLMCFLLEKKNGLEDIFYKFLIITFIVIIIFGIVEYIQIYRDYQKQDLLSSARIRLKLFLTNELVLGSFLARFYGLYFALFLRKNFKSIYDKITFAAISTLTFIVVLHSGERTSLFFLFLIFVLSFFFLKINIKLKVLFLFLIVCIFSGSILLNSNIKSAVIFDSNNKIQFKKNEKIIVFTETHTGHYKTAWKMFKDKPIFGHGPKMFRIVCHDIKFTKNSAGCSTHPHNTYLQILAETGLAGFFFLILALFSLIFIFLKDFILYYFKKTVFLNNYQVVLSIVVLITLWPLSPSGNFFNNWLLITYSLPASFFVKEFFKKQV